MPPKGLKKAPPLRRREKDSAAPIDEPKKKDFSRTIPESVTQQREYIVEKVLPVVYRCPPVEPPASDFVATVAVGDLVVVGMGWKPEIELKKAAAKKHVLCMKRWNLKIEALEKALAKTDEMGLVDASQDTLKRDLNRLHSLTKHPAPRFLSVCPGDVCTVMLPMRDTSVSWVGVRREQDGIRGYVPSWILTKAEQIDPSVSLCTATQHYDAELRSELPIFTGQRYKLFFRASYLPLRGGDIYASNKRGGWFPEHCVRVHKGGRVGPLPSLRLSTASEMFRHGYVPFQSLVDDTLRAGEFDSLYIATREVIPLETGQLRAQLGALVFIQSLSWNTQQSGMALGQVEGTMEVGWVPVESLHRIVENGIDRKPFMDPSRSSKVSACEPVEIPSPAEEADMSLMDIPSSLLKGDRLLVIEATSKGEKVEQKIPAVLDKNVRLTLLCRLLSRKDGEALLSAPFFLLCNRHTGSLADRSAPAAPLEESRDSDEMAKAMSFNPAPRVRAQKSEDVQRSPPTSAPVTSLRKLRKNVPALPRIQEE